MMRKFFLSCFLLLMIVLFVSCASDEQAAVRSVRVMLTEAEGMVILGENPVVIEAGQTAEFPVSLDEKYKITSLSDNAVYADGVIRLENVQYPNTITAETGIRQKFFLEYARSMNDGKITVTPGSGQYYEGTVITAVAEPKEGMYFIGFSKGGSLTDGGEFLSSSTEYSFTLTENTELYGNFSNSPAKYLIYHANGGYVTESGEETYRIFTASDFYLCPNTLPLQGIFEREGYTLIGYNTAADGSGEFYGAGWNIPAEEMETELWLQWAKETPAEQFTYEYKGDNIMITGYTGDDTMLVIPEKIEGAMVTEVKRGVFVDCAFDTIVFPRHMQRIQNGAFEDCSAVHTLYLPDSITAMTDRIFDDVSTVKKIYVNAVQDPSFSYALMGTGAVKFERLMTIDEPKIILISGSSSLYGINSALFMEELGGEYQLVNFGCHATTPSAFFMEMAAAFVNEGDLVVTAPEPLYEQWGDTVFNTTLWQIFEAAYNAFSFVDISHYDNVLSSFANFNKLRSPLNKTDYNYHLEYYSAFGDYELPRPNADASHVTFNNGILDFSSSFLSEKHFTAYNRSADLITANGGKVLMSFAPTNRNALSESSKKRAYRDSFVEEIKEKYHVEIISDLDDYLFKGMYFYDTDLHMSNEGADLRTKQLADDIRAYLYE